MHLGPRTPRQAEYAFYLDIYTLVKCAVLLGISSCHQEVSPSALSDLKAVFDNPFLVVTVSSSQSCRPYSTYSCNGHLVRSRSPLAQAFNQSSRLPSPIRRAPKLSSCKRHDPVDGVILSQTELKSYAAQKLRETGFFC